MRVYWLTLSFLCTALSVAGQSSIKSTNSIAEQVLLGNYDPATYLSGSTSEPVTSLPALLNKGVSPDSLQSLIIRLSEFKTRHTTSDTLSATEGIGAARRWVHQKFENYSSRVNNRLLPSYLSFRKAICGVPDHKNIFAVLPGTDTANHRVVLLEGHIDSRCESVCNNNCVAEGVEDNASGTALVMELARVMSQYQFPNTLVFLITIGEEQGLYGADAFADYVVDKSIPLHAVLNNDVIGGILCGETSSPPSCPGLNDVDSLNTRLFSFGGFNSSSKQLARYVKLEYKEMLKPIVKVPMDLHIMTNEDRIGRGGDHIPFRQQGYPAIRFTAANEHGDASNGPDYHDRQHTVNDVLGVDTDGDQVVDSFFVDFNYLARNGVINGNAAAMICNSPSVPDLEVDSFGYDGLHVTILTEGDYPAYRVAVRSIDNDWDTVFTTTEKSSVFLIPDSAMYFVSAANVNEDGIESLFSEEKLQVISSVEKENKLKNNGVELLQNRPNPFDESTIIPIYVSSLKQAQQAELQILSLEGNIVYTETLALQEGLNEWPYHHGFGAVGTFFYRLVINGEVMDTKTMVFAY